MGVATFFLLYSDVSKCVMGYRKVKTDGGGIILCLGCWLDVEIWPLEEEEVLRVLYRTSPQW